MEHAVSQLFKRCGFLVDSIKLNAYNLSVWQKFNTVFILAVFIIKQSLDLEKGSFEYSFLHK